MSDEIMLMIGDDGKAALYDDTYDLTIHCESEEEQNEVKKALESIPKWIPCSERLPSDHERYLLTEEVHYTTGRIIRRVLMAFYDDENDEWYEEMGEDVEVVSYPLAWMPPPEPWKGEEE